MSFTNNVIINSYSIVLLLIIYIQNRKNAEKSALTNILYNRILQTTAVMLVIDILSRFDGHPGTVYVRINAIGNFLVFLFGLVLPSLWLMYAHHQVFHDDRKANRLIWPLLGINLLNALILLGSQANGWYYTIDADNIYQRGPLYWVPASLAIILLLTGTAVIAANRKIIDQKHYFSLMFFVIPPLVSIVLQILFYGISLMLNCVVISIIIVFFNIQNRSIYTDYLTGINNRKRLDAYMAEKISTCTAKKTFAAILLDIDNFKTINDTFGHQEGDEALTIAAGLLKSSLRANDLVARFGGDEFYIILDISDPLHLEAAIGRIKQNMEKYNKTSTKPYNISFSMGYAIYDQQTRPTLEAFQKQVDIMMYANKRSVA